MNAKMMMTMIVCLVLVIVSISGYAAAYDQNSPVTDQDHDGLVDKWESDHGYNNTTADNPLKNAAKDQVVDKGRYDYQSSYLFTFIYVTIISFGLFSLVLGAFTTRYAQGKSRITGAILLATGILIGILFIIFSLFAVKKYPNDTLIPEYGIIHWEAQLVLMPFFTVLAAGVGALLALIFFLVIIMKA